MDAERGEGVQAGSFAPVGAAPGSPNLQEELRRNRTAAEEREIKARRRKLSAMMRERMKDFDHLERGPSSSTKEEGGAPSEVAGPRRSGAKEHAPNLSSDGDPS
jgi:hypothetical protein